MTLTDKTGAPVTVTKHPDRFTIEVDGQQVGLLDYQDRDGRRAFPHTEVDESFGGRGLGTIVVAEALAATRAEGLRIVPICSMAQAYADQHHEYDDNVDQPTS